MLHSEPHTTPETPPTLSVAGRLTLPEKPVIVMFGPPLSGKGTQAKILAHKLGIPHISTGDMFRDAALKDTPLAKELLAYTSSKNLVPDELTIRMVRERLQQPDCARGFILDGFPRTMEQAHALETMLREMNLESPIVIYLKVDESVLITERLPKRIQESSIRRADDDPEILKGRIDTFNQQTLPLMDFYQAGQRLCLINGNGAITQTRDQIEICLGLQDSDTPK